MIIKPSPTIDYKKCNPRHCSGGICSAGMVCPHRAFYQETPYDFPMTDAGICAGCGDCIAACPLKAIRML